MSIGFKEGQDKINFSDHIQCMLDDGRNVSFWYNLQCCDQSIKEAYSDLYVIVVHKYGNVYDMCQWSERVLIWNIQLDNVETNAYIGR